MLIIIRNLIKIIDGNISNDNEKEKNEKWFVTLLVETKQDEIFRNVALKKQKQESSPETIGSVFCQQKRH